jgi:hypothetical protein
MAGRRIPHGRRPPSVIADLPPRGSWSESRADSPARAAPGGPIPPPSGGGGTYARRAPARWVAARMPRFCVESPRERFDETHGDGGEAFDTRSHRAAHQAANGNPSGDEGFRHVCQASGCAVSSEEQPAARAGSDRPAGPRVGESSFRRGRSLRGRCVGRTGVVDPLAARQLRQLRPASTLVSSPFSARGAIRAGRRILPARALARTPEGDCAWHPGARFAGGDSHGSRGRPSPVAAFRRSGARRRDRLSRQRRERRNRNDPIARSACVPVGGVATSWPLR